MTRRSFLGGLAAAAAGDAAVNEQRFQIGGEWCFIKFPRRPNQAVVLTLHGAGEWVRETSSSWEEQTGATRLMESLLEAGFAVAQSNSAARNGNGMWGNPQTQTTTAALMGTLRHRHSFQSVHAVAVSAGNLILANLLLNHKARFDRAVMLAPCVSLASEYKCPGGVNRVKTIAEAYGFPARACPGDPAHDADFLRATAHDDSLRVLERLGDSDLRAAFGTTQWMAAYETGDPRVPPAENILPFATRLKRAGIPVRIEAMEADTHGSQELFVRYTPAIVDFLARTV